MFKKEEQNFVFVNEIDNMALIMPSQDKHSGESRSKPDQLERGSKMDAVSALKRRRQRRIELNACLNVACLKRLLPIGLNLFGGHDQELVQQAKQRLIEVGLALMREGLHAYLRVHLVIMMYIYLLVSADVLVSVPRRRPSGSYRQNDQSKHSFLPLQLEILLLVPLIVSSLPVRSSGFVVVGH